MLDTWFSSALWPFATLGWPKDARTPRDLNYYYPTQGLFTAQEILYLWVARMIMTGEEFLGEKPFEDVYIHATILDEKGRRMSKSLGNGVDPVDLINLYGADALRFMLMREAGQRQDIRIKPIRDDKQEQGEQARNFCNKIWNASRFALMNLEGFQPPIDEVVPTHRPLEDQWILGRLRQTAIEANKGFASYNMDDAANALYHFIWDDFCDWYIESAKARLQGTDEEANKAREVLWFTLEQTLRLLHPIMPFITEAIWQALPGAQEFAGVKFLMLAEYPNPPIANQYGVTWIAPWERVQTIVRTLRNLQAENSLKKGGPAYFAPKTAIENATAIDNRSLIEFLTRFTPLNVGPLPNGEFITNPTRFGDVSLPRPQASPEDLAAEKTRIEKELAKIEKDLTGLMVRLENPAFVDSAPEPVVTKARQQAAELEDKKAKLRERLTI